jgi:hypothetical protein
VDQNPKIIYEALTSGVKGFGTALRALRDEPMTDEDIMDLLVREFEEADMSESGPAVRHREWLQALGYVKRKYGVNRLTEDGEELAESTEERKSLEPSSSHTSPREEKPDGRKEEELIQSIREVGEKLGKRPSVEDMKNASSYDWNDYQSVFDNWTTALEKAGYEDEHRNQHTNSEQSEDENEGQENENILEFSKDGVRIKEAVQKPLTGGKKEVTIERLDESSFPINNLYLHVTSVERDEKDNNLRLQFTQISDTELDTEYLLEFTDSGAELKEITEKVFGEGKKEVTIENIDWDQKVTNTIDMWVAEIRLQNSDPYRPALGLSSIDKQK